VPGCVDPGKGILLVRRGTKSERNLLVWKWMSGPPTSKADFGDPLATDDYTLCLYDGAAGPVAELTAPAGGTCVSRPCWNSIAPGYRYRDGARTPDGLLKVLLREDPVGGRAKIIVKGKGELLRLPLVSTYASPVTFQLRRKTGGCWQTIHTAPFRRPGPDLFRDDTG